MSSFRTGQQKPPKQKPSNLVTLSLAQAVEHHQAGRFAEAERLYRSVIDLVPHHGDALHLLAMLHLQNKKPEQALPLLQDALRIQPNNPIILSNLGLASLELKQSKEAADYLRKSLKINPDNVENLSGLGQALNELGDYEAALACHQKVLHKNPNDAMALRNLAAVLHNMGRLEDVRGLLERALQLEPSNAELIVNCGELEHNLGNIDEAMKFYDRALAIAPEDQLAQFRKSYGLLARGEYREGWKLYEVGLGRRDLRGALLFEPAKPWNGSPGMHKHLLVWREQGLGDALHFIRYAQLCKTRVGKVSVLCPKPLLRLFKGLPYVDDAFEKPLDGSYFDDHVPMMSLPHLFDTVLETIPGKVPYLQVDPEIQGKWAKKFEEIRGFKIGLVWAGGEKIGNFVDRRRSISLERMKPWLDLPGARFYNLQMGKPAEQIAELGLADRLIDFMGEVEDFADTAAIVQNLDLVITVDTSVAHLAGGLGKPVWILSRYDADWRWLQNRPTNPWYPTARIFGQPKMDDWDSVVTEVGRELEMVIAKSAS